MRYVDIGVFAHNEQKNIGFLINDLDQQTICNEAGTNLSVRILCNGCRDRTVEVAQIALENTEYLKRVAALENFKDPGKTLTWNRFVSSLHDESNYVIFIDGDIRIKDTKSISNLLDELQQGESVAVTSRPLKNLCKIRRNPLLYAAAVFINREHRDGSISGMFYAVKTETIRQIRLPVPCLVEDGFLAACLVTGLFTFQGSPQRIKASQSVKHYFETPSSLHGFFKHDVRLALGCELNAAFYSDLWAANSVQDRVEILQQYSMSSGIDRCIEEHQKHPEKSALAKTITFCNLKGRSEESFSIKLIHFPFRLAHSFYMALVHYSARRLFARKQFQW